ncbi:MAG: hypothetical protein H7249_11890 [Chitinophagaceae bacterium]|nr:hypothetical protein [Oligoflexus sp.]
MNLLSDLEKADTISATNVRVIEKYCSRWGVSAYHALLQTHMLTEHDLADAIAETYSIDRVYSFDKNDLDLSVLRKVSYADAIRYQCCAPQRDEKGSYLVYIVDPTNQTLMSFLSQHLDGYRLVVVDLTLMARSIEEAYPLELQLPSLESLEPRTP